MPPNEYPITGDCCYADALVAAASVRGLIDASERKTTHTAAGCFARVLLAAAAR